MKIVTKVTRRKLMSLRQRSSNALSEYLSAQRRTRKTTEKAALISPITILKQRRISSEMRDVHSTSETSSRMMCSKTTMTPLTSDPNSHVLQST